MASANICVVALVSFRSEFQLKLKSIFQCVADMRTLYLCTYDDMSQQTVYNDMSRQNMLAMLMSTQIHTLKTHET